MACASARSADASAAVACGSASSRLRPSNTSATARAAAARGLFETPAKDIPAAHEVRGGQNAPAGALELRHVQHAGAAGDLESLATGADHGPGRRGCGRAACVRQPKADAFAGELAPGHRGGIEGAHLAREYLGRLC